MALLDYLAEFAKENKISKELGEKILAEAFLTLYRRKFGKEYTNMEIHIDRKLHLYQVKKVVDEVTDPITQITAEEGLKYTRKKSLKVGEEVRVPLDMEEFTDRQGVMVLKQTIKQKLVEVQRDWIYSEFITRQGSLVNAKIKSKTDKPLPGYLAMLEWRDAEAFLPLTETIPEEEIRPGTTVRAILLKVNPASASFSEPQLILSRACKEMVIELLKLNIPELMDGTFSIKAIARKPGEVTKVVIQSTDESLDPASVTIGKQGVRIKPIRAEINDERVEIIRYSDDVRELIKNAVMQSRVLRNRTAEVYHVELNSEEKLARVVVPDEFVAPLIGKKGTHQRMLEEVVGYRISFVPYSEFQENLAQKQKEVDRILGLSEVEEAEVELVEEESIPLEMLPFSREQIKTLHKAGFNDVAEIIEKCYSIERLAEVCNISVDEAVAIWQVIKDNITIEDEVVEE
ncbi:Transcription termination protein NusA [Brevinematales bacterium NS]|nr:transcription termination/antitermination protein NusA [Brevinematales bacterium]QJR21177.1 Transcription termination protein NusA [Brevinematales bacterium NS]